MKIAFITQTFSEGMGYTENILPRAFAALGHDVHVVASTLQAYGNLPGYDLSYGRFLGPAERPAGIVKMDGFTLYRLPYSAFRHYIKLQGLQALLKALRPDVMQLSQAASLDTFALTIGFRSPSCPVFTECHQHASVAWRPSSESALKNLCGGMVYRMTRTFPAWLAHRRVERCFAISPDCVETARSLYGVPDGKIVLLPLGTDTDLFHPCVTVGERGERTSMRAEWGVKEEDLVAVYTGRFSSDKDPLCLAKSVASLRSRGVSSSAVFVGSGPQEAELKRIPGCIVLGFRKHNELAAIYRSADVGVWPRQESMSMLDALSSGLAVVASDKMGEPQRIEGSGLTYREGDAASLASALHSLAEPVARRRLGEVGRNKMLKAYSWTKHAKVRVGEYEKALLGLQRRRYGGAKR